MPDFTPNLTGQIFAQSLGNIVDKYEKHQEENKQRARLDAAYGTIAEQLGFDKNYLKSTSLEQKKGLVEGKQMAGTLEHLKNQAAESKARQAQMAYIQDQHAAQTAWQKDAFGTGDNNAADMGQEVNPSVMGMLQSAGRHGYDLPIGQLDDMMRAVNANRASGPLVPGILEGPGGAKIVYNPTTGAPGHVFEAPSNGSFEMLFPKKPDGTMDTTQPFYRTRGGVSPFSKKAAEAPGDGPTLSKDGKFYWSPAVNDWKPVKSDGGMQDIVDAIRGESGKPAPGKGSSPALRYRRNTKTGELEKY